MFTRQTLASAMARPAARLPMPAGWAHVSRIYSVADAGDCHAWERVTRPDAAALYQRGAFLYIDPDRPWVARLDLSPLAPQGSGR